MGLGDGRHIIIIVFVSAENPAVGSEPVSNQKSDLKKLQDLCTRKNWHVVNVPADGQCMFSSLAIRLGRPLATEAIRKELVEYLRTHANIVSSLNSLSIHADTQGAM